MKNIILGLFLLLSLHSFTQSKFREMNWGATPSQLKSNNTDVQWETETEGEIKIFTTEDYIAGLKVTIAYYFVNDKLKRGGYFFDESHTSDNLYYDDYISISTILNKKYDMEMNKKWNDTTWEDNPNYIGHALKSGDVEITETYEDELTSIIHRISSDDNRGIKHTLLYSDLEYVKKIRASELKGF